MIHTDQNDITFFAKTNFRNQDRVFGIKTDDRRRHMYVIGKTGMGKTNLLENLAIQDIQKGHGIAFIDPHGDTAEKLIRAIPANRINDVIYFNPADQDFPIAFNVMEKVSPEYRHLVASGLVGVFKKIWADSWGPRLEYILRNAILALLEYPGSTLLGVTRILVDKSYRDRVVEKVTDPVVRSFWVDEFSKWNDRVLQEVISPIQNKVGQFLTSSLIRNIVGQTTSSFDVRDVMDGRKILIMNLSKGRIGEDNSALLGAMIITKIQLAAMARVDIPEDDRNDFYLYVDEFQNFATESFANILSEARKYHLNLVLANQYVTQIDEKVRDAIFGNAGSIISFRVGAMDAEFLEKEFEPVFIANDLVNLEKYNIYLKLMIDGIAGDAFSATTLPPIKLEDAGNEEKIIHSSRERYSSSKIEVEDKIRRWSGMLTAEERQAFAGQSSRARDVQTTVEKNTSQRKQIHSPSPMFSRGKEHKPVYPQKREEHVVVTRETPMAEIPANEIVPASLEKKEEGEQKEKNISQGEESVEKKMYAALCATCGVDIAVPFEPDGKRPTFCKDCLRDYQRATAKVRNETVPKENVASNNERAKKKDVRTMQPKAYVSSDAPMSLGQVQHVGPKKFKTLQRRPSVNLQEVRSLIDQARKNTEE
ncbi:MAG: type IV secretion system DNA-binding domain-containing protein [Candidatus Moranbacteria bacterium]|nr:type IV secretion system DNA-binding domain-containing protein [Candidatus Moranbacteria bacterium]